MELINYFKGHKRVTEELALLILEEILEEIQSERQPKRINISGRKYIINPNIAKTSKNTINIYVEDQNNLKRAKFIISQNYIKLIEYTSKGSYYYEYY